jgi:hypothetical protein
MPLTQYTCQIAGGCDLLVPNSTTASHYGGTGPGAPPVPLANAIAIPVMQVAPGSNPGNGAIRVQAQGNRFYIWAESGFIHWVNQANLGVQTVGPANNANRCFNLSMAAGEVQFGIV